MIQTKPKTKDNPVGFRKLIGLVTKELHEGYAVMELTVSPEHLNSHGSLHGGIAATMIDHAGGIAGCFCERTGKRRKAVTLSLTTSFLAPVSGGILTATSRKRPGGRRIYVSTTEIADETGRLIAVGEATYRYVDP
ncbi:MAG TPA: PaaI family thioesterase [Geobacteraceae bacterium]|nr:PaaI family thioesterase [Geobacteraceae bacterium]